jgi:hypothetical protein
MTNTKPTLRDHYNELSALVSLALESGIITSEKADEHISFINGRMEQLAKKNTTDRKPTKTQVANVELAKNILEVMNCGQIYTVSEILKNLNDSALTQSKISAVIRPMLTVTKDGTVNPNGVIERFEEKGKAYFRKLDLAEEAED